MTCWLFLDSHLKKTVFLDLPLKACRDIVWFEALSIIRQTTNFTLNVHITQVTSNVHLLSKLCWQFVLFNKYVRLIAINSKWYHYQFIMIYVFQFLYFHWCIATELQLNVKLKKCGIFIMPTNNWNQGSRLQNRKRLNSKTVTNYQVNLISIGFKVLCCYVFIFIYIHEPYLLAPEQSLVTSGSRLFMFLFN